MFVMCIVGVYFTIIFLIVLIWTATAMKRVGIGCLPIDVTPQALHEILRVRKASML